MTEYINHVRKRFLLRHFYFKRTGLYKMLFINLLKIIGLMLILLLLISVVERYIIDLDVLFERMVEHIHVFWVFVIFAISEALLGLLPPDFFIIWCKQFPQPYLAVTLLSVLSYGGGIASFFIGRLLQRNKRIENLIKKKFSKNMESVRKWGGLFIVIAALFPLPFAITCLLVGLSTYNFKTFLWVSLTRIPRFHIYAYFFFEIAKI